MTVSTTVLREIADKAKMAEQDARARRIEARDSDNTQTYLDETYAQGVEDALRYLADDAAPTDALAAVLALDLERDR